MAASNELQISNRIRMLQFFNVPKAIGDPHINRAYRIYCGEEEKNDIQMKRWFGRQSNAVIWNRLRLYYYFLTASPFQVWNLNVSTICQFLFFAFRKHLEWPNKIVKTEKKRNKVKWRVVKKLGEDAISIIIVDTLFWFASVSQFNIDESIGIGA